jgi:uncharacterized protein (DUF433 family)
MSENQRRRRLRSRPIPEPSIFTDESVAHVTLTEQDPGVINGALRFAGTQVPVQALIDYRKRGLSVETFVADFPSVSLQIALQWLVQRTFADFGVDVEKDEAMPTTAEHSIDDRQTSGPETSSMALASDYLKLLPSTPERPIALFSQDEARTTSFLRNNLAKLAESEGFTVLHIDARSHAVQPIEAINELLIASLNQLTEQELEALDRRFLSPHPSFRLDSLVKRISSATNRPFLLLIENLDALLETPNSRDVLSSIRAVLLMRKHQLFAIFTSSSRERMGELFSVYSAPMYLFVHRLDLPPVGEK